MTAFSNDMLARVEGHGTIELIREGGRVVDARLELHESPRLFEALLTGRRFDEVADIACRICSICSTVHKVAALQAVEQATGVVISRQTSLLRELAVQGGQIESHALHIFCLALPDHLGVGGFPGLASVAPRELQQGLRIKAAGNRIQEVIGGRAIHPVNLLLGGMGAVPEAAQLYGLRDELHGIYSAAVACIDFVSGLDDILPPLPPLRLCAVNGGPPLFGDRLVSSAGQDVPAVHAAEWLNEKVELHTHAKVSHFDETVPFMVGPLARILLTKSVEYGHRITDTSVRSSLKARAVELQQALDRSLVLIENLLEEGLKNEPDVRITPVQGDGVALIEAPRGVLLHSYGFDGAGICCRADIITPTAINQLAMTVSLKELVAVMDGAGYAEVKATAEALIRCFDPCISCAVH